MAQTYCSVLNDVYKGYSFTRHCTFVRNKKYTPSKYMEIPVNKDTFELPVFALSQFFNAIRTKPDLETLVAELYFGGATPNYATLSRYMKDILQERLSTHLIKITIPVQNDSIIYYGTHGAVFDTHLRPIMMCLWQVSRTPKPDDNLSYAYHLERPILKVSPNCFLRQADPMERFLAKKLPAEALALNMRYFNPDTEESRHYTVKVEIDKFPFTLKEVNKPSTSISDASLLQIARDHIEEIEL